MTTHEAKAASDLMPTYNISGSCLWTLATIVPLAALLVVLAF